MEPLAVRKDRAPWFMSLSKVAVLLLVLLAPAEGSALAPSYDFQ